MTDESRETFGFPIEVTLTSEEKLENLDRIANIDRKILSLEGDKAAANQRFTEEFKALKKERLTRLEQDTAGKAKVEVECYQERDDRRGMMLTMRCDNGHIVDERALTAEEREVDDRQGDLFAGGKPDSAAGSADSDEEDEGQSDPDLENTLDEYNAQQNAAGADDDSEEATAH